MKVSFACPSCNAAGSVDAVHIGKQVRCKHCGAHFAIPDPEASQPDVYALEESSAEVNARYIEKLRRRRRCSCRPELTRDTNRTATAERAVCVGADDSQCSR